MMNNEPTSADFEAARAATQLLVDSIPVDPGSVFVRLSEGDAINPRRFEMRIGSVILAHELEQAGVVLGSTTLEDCVRDLKGNRETAVQAYLALFRLSQALKPKEAFWEFSDPSKQSQRWFYGLRALMKFI